MPDDQYALPPPPTPEQTQLAQHPHEQRRANIAIAIAILAVFGTAWQAWEAHQARIDAKTAADSQAKDVERSRVAAEKSADAAQSVADTAADTLTRSIESFRIDERAWIEIAPPTPILKVPASTTYGGALFTYDFFLKNVGKTAAFEIAVRAPRGAIDGGLSLGDDSAQIKRLQEKLSHDLFGSKLTSNDEVILLSERNAKTLGPGVNSFSAFQLNGQEPRFERYRFLVGRIDYKDAFSISHWSTFCFFVDTGGALRYCREGNDEDRNPEIQPTTATPKK
jgi:hypothetical protein